MVIVSLLAVFGLCFLLKESDGPFNIISRWRNLMLRMPFIGVQFHSMISCWYCSGCWSALAIYLIAAPTYNFVSGLLFVLAGGATCLILDSILNRVNL